MSNNILPVISTPVNSSNKVSRKRPSFNQQKYYLAAASKEKRSVSQSVNKLKGKWNFQKDLEMSMYIKSSERKRFFTKRNYKRIKLKPMMYGKSSQLKTLESLQRSRTAKHKQRISEQREKRTRENRNKQCLKKLGKLPVKATQILDRKNLFRKVDENGNGMLSLLETRVGMKMVLGEDFVNHVSQTWKQAILASFTVALSSAKKKKFKDCQFLQIFQFRRLLLALKQYFEYFFAYSKIDIDGDRTLSQKEFEEAAEIVQKWSGPIEDMAAAFAEIDDDGSGEIDFDEFCDWAIRKSFKAQNLENDDVLEQDEESKLLHAEMVRQSKLKKQKKAAEKKAIEGWDKKQSKIQGSLLQTEKFFYEDTLTLPTDNTPEQNEIRVKLFKQIDGNGNGFLSILETRQGMKDIIGDGFLKNYRRGWKQAISEAFNLATASAQQKGLKNSNFLQVHQFRRLLLALKQYFEYFKIYLKIDDDGDKMLTYDEFCQAAVLVEKFSGKIEDMQQAFYDIDQDNSKEIDFDEFCDWAIKLSFKSMNIDNDDFFDSKDKDSEQQVKDILKFQQGKRDEARGIIKSGPKVQKKKNKHTKLLATIAALPTEKEQIEERRKLFRKIDENGNGFLSLLEVRQGVWNILGDSFAQKWSRGWKSAIQEAFSLATLSARQQRKESNNFLQIHQFRRLLLALKQYFEYFVTFLQIDIDNDRTISIVEFRGCKAILEKWTGPIKSIDDAFYEIDGDRSGEIDFDEFCSWAITKSFQALGVDKDDLKEKEEPFWRKMAKEKQANKMKKFENKLHQSSKKTKKKKKKKQFCYKKINELPSAKFKKWERQQLFKKIDDNGNGFLSLMEIRQGLKEIMVKGFMSNQERGWKAAISSAFKLATMSAKKQKLRNSDFLQIFQFRRLLLALKQYFEFYAAYSRIDNDGDNTLSFEEFQLAAEVIEKWSGQITDWAASFRDIDVDGSGSIDFDEFCTWAIEKSFKVNNVDDDDENERKVIVSKKKSYLKNSLRNMIITRQHLDMDHNLSKSFFKFNVKF